MVSFSIFLRFSTQPNNPLVPIKIQVKKFSSYLNKLVLILIVDKMLSRPRPDKTLLIPSILKPDKKLPVSKTEVLSGTILDKVSLSDEAAPAEAAVNDTTNRIASKTLVIFLILSRVCLPILFPPLISLKQYNLKTIEFHFTFMTDIN